MKRGGNRFEPYANPAKRYRAFITNIPFDVKWQSLKDLVKEKGKVQPGWPRLSCAQPVPGSVCSSAVAPLAALGHRSLGKLFPKPSRVLHNLSPWQPSRGRFLWRPLACSCWSFIPGLGVFSLGIQPQAFSGF